MESRNIALTLDKAKKWYKQGGELKEVALQAYKEEELTMNGLPRTWEEFCENYPKGEQVCLPKRRQKHILLLCNFIS